MIDLSQFQQAPEAIEITGISGAVPIHRFSWHDLQEQVIPSIEGKLLECSVLFFLNGKDYQFDEAHIDAVKKTFSLKQIVEIYYKGLEINGLGEEADEAAKKNSS